MADQLRVPTRAVALQLADTAEDVAVVFERLADCRTQLATITPTHGIELRAAARRARAFADWERQEAVRLRDVRWTAGPRSSKAPDVPRCAPLP